MKKILMFIAMVMTSITMMAQSQFYVIMKDGSGASYPENIVDSLTFDNPNGAKIYGFEDLAKSIAQLRKEVDSLKRALSLVAVDSSYFTHEYVDLGLPSKILWATCNVGAKKPSDYGLYFSWGETETKTFYPRTGGKWGQAELATLISQGVVDSENNLTSQYDAATVFWGKEWNMPTSENFKELVSYCTSQWTEINGVNGILFTSKVNNNTIFFPSAGFKRESEPTVQIGVRGYYGSATVNDDSYSFNYLYLSQEEIKMAAFSRSYGITVRPIRKNDIDGYEYVDLDLPSGTLWAKRNLNAPCEEASGDSFAWGETVTKEVFTESNSRWMKKTNDELKALGVINSTGILNPAYDAATTIMGENWRMPTKEEFAELYDNCTVEIGETQGGWHGVVFTGKNGNKLFFPYSVSYWTSNSVDEDLAYVNTFVTKEIENKNSNVPITVTCISPTGKCTGQAIRAVVVK